MKAIFQVKDDYIQIRQATQQGWIPIYYSDLPCVADLSYPTSKLRRGRVQGGGGISPTVTTTGGLYVFERTK